MTLHKSWTCCKIADNDRRRWLRWCCNVITQDLLCIFKVATCYGTRRRRLRRFGIEVTSSKLWLGNNWCQWSTLQICAEVLPYPCHVNARPRLVTETVKALLHKPFNVVQPVFFEASNNSIKERFVFTLNQSLYILQNEHLRLKDFYVTAYGVTDGFTALV